MNSTKFVYLTIRKGRVLIKSPYNRLFVELLKVNIPAINRTWTPETALWSVTMDYREKVVELIGQCYGKENIRWEVDTPDFFGADVDWEAERREQARRQEEARRQSARDREERARRQRADQEERARSWREEQQRRRSTFHSNGSASYEILFVTPDAPLEVVEAAYKALVKHWHPDRNNSPDATGRTQQINSAYDEVKKIARPLR